MDTGIDADAKRSTPTLCAAVHEELESLTAITSPRERAERAGVVIEVLRQAVADVARERSAAFRELRESGWTLGRIARVYGLSRSRAQQLSAPAAADLDGVGSDTDDRD